MADDVQPLRGGDILEKVSSTTQNNLQDVWERPTGFEKGADLKPGRIALLFAKSI